MLAILWGRTLLIWSFGVHGSLDSAATSVVESKTGDLFAKHLEFKAMFDQLVQLFICDFRDGRAATAPMLKKGWLAGTSTDQAVHLHNTSVLPHLHAAEDIGKLFPLGYTGRAGADDGELGVRGLFRPTPARFVQGQCKETAIFLACPRGLYSNGDLEPGLGPIGGKVAKSGS